MFEFIKKIFGGGKKEHCKCGSECCQDPAEVLKLTPEDVETLKKLDPKIVIGRVEEVGGHPDPTMTRVQITQTTVAPGQVEQILCGGSNVGEGIIVAVATVGTKLNDDFEIGVRAIRGEESHGMICARKELGISLNGEGEHEIWILPESMSMYLGKPLCELV